MRLLFVFCLSVGIVLPGYAHNRCIGYSRSSAAKTTVADLAENDYDVHYVNMNLSVTNMSTAISGHVATRVLVTAPVMQDYVFELSPQLTIDSIKINGQMATVQTNGFVCRVQNLALAANTLFQADVWYHGQPAGGAGFFSNGLLHGTGGTGNTPVTHTVSAAFHSRDWWPCKQSLQDKIDSADLSFTVADTLTVASNGTLHSVTSLPGGQKRYQWRSRYPIDYYLLSFAVAPYQLYSYYMLFPGSADSMIIRNYLYPDADVLANHQDELDSIAHIINYFSDIFTKYPFAKEQFGVCQAPLGGGMENQTMVSLGSLDSWLIAHELSHQWWGDHVTCATLKDMWLNEGWATYCEQLFTEHFHGAAAAKTMRTVNYANVMTLPGGSVYVSDTTDELRIYDGRLTYNKGGAVAHMLRYYINDDTVFKTLLRQYHQTFQYGVAATDDFKNLAESVSGLDLDTFFKQWVYLEGYPTYSLRWFQDNNGNVFLRLKQVASMPASVPIFKMPVEIRLIGGSGDTLVRLFNDQPTQDYSFPWSGAMLGAQIDPNDHIVNKSGAILKDTTLNVAANEQRATLQIFPNPTKDGWWVKNTAAGQRIQLSDASGRILWRGLIKGTQIFIPANNLAPGSYWVQLETPAGVAVVQRVQKE